MKDIGKLFEQYGSDKNDLSHDYGKYYQKHLPININALMEIGTWRGASIKAFKEFYNDEGKFHTINYIFGGEIISVKELENINVVAHEGKQENIFFLKTINDLFTVIVDDGSHHSDAQLITFKQMFINNLESGGLYVCEDVYGHLEGDEGKYWRRGIVDTPQNTIMGIMRNYLNGGTLESQFITKEENDLLMSLIDEVNIYDDKIIFIKHK